MNFELGAKQTFFYVEPEAYEGVRQIAGKVAKDIEAVTGICPAVTDQWAKGQVIVCATLGKSPLADDLVSRGVLEQSRLSG